MKTLKRRAFSIVLVALMLCYQAPFYAGEDENISMQAPLTEEVILNDGGLENGVIEGGTDVGASVILRLPKQISKDQDFSRYREFRALTDT